VIIKAIIINRRVWGKACRGHKTVQSRFIFKLFQTFATLSPYGWGDLEDSHDRFNLMSACHILILGDNLRCSVLWLCGGEDGGWDMDMSDDNMPKHSFSLFFLSLHLFLSDAFALPRFLSFLPLSFFCFLSFTHTHTSYNPFWRGRGVFRGISRSVVLVLLVSLD